MVMEDELQEIVHELEATEPIVSKDLSVYLLKTHKKAFAFYCP